MVRSVALLSVAFALACGPTHPAANVEIASLRGPQPSPVAAPERSGAERIVFEGNQELSRSELLSVMHFPASGAYSEEALESDVLLVFARYMDRGYADAHVGPPLREAGPTGQERVRIPIKEGVRYRIGKLVVQEAGGRTPADLRARVRPRPGDWFNRGVLAADLEALRRSYRDQGYGLVETNILSAHAEPGVLDFTISFALGPRIVIDHVEITGDPSAPTQRIRRELGLADGSFYNETVMEAAASRVRALGLPDDVRVSAKGTAEDPRWTVVVELTPR